MARKNEIPRRQFLTSTAAMAGSFFGPNAILLEQPLLAVNAKTVPPSDRVRFGMIGVGMQGSGLLANAITLPGIECVAAADLYDGRHTLAKEITGNSNLPVTRQYHELLDRKDIDCIVAAVPDHWHQRIVVDTCHAGKAIYCEKPMSHTIAQGFEMVEAAHKNERIVQIGSQRVSSVLCAKARELYHGGAIGEIEMVELTLGRNDPTGAWEYPPPFDLSPETLDWDTWLNDAPKIPFDKYRFARWRCWKEYGTGVAGDLMVHLLSGMLCTLGWNEPPRSASALGGIFRWKDGRNMPDLQSVLFDYHGVPVYVRLSLGAETPEVARFMGPQGILEASEQELHYFPQTGVDTEPSYYASSFPAKMRAEYEQQWHAEHDPKPGHEPLNERTTYRGNSWDDVKPHLWNFFQAVKTRKPVIEDAVFGNHAAIACHMANESYFRKQPVYWDDGARTVES
ncbi:MAG: Gfo/Idh/MocA family oxidoreductase [Acidobacteriaceae bacterium]|nr:Gfo/Idh/MocA family oxidoreductase [Acidobacteriaceae bacterium]MBV9778454.1 Gfo/Idh/MocA family oxidoreductase [Acidobacteriaceae bacterium]